jgi:hypothetical protein
MSTHFISTTQASLLRDRELVVDSSFMGNGPHAGKIRMSIKHGPTGKILCQGFGVGDDKAFEDAWTRLPDNNGITTETDELKAKVEELQKQLAEKSSEKPAKTNGKPVTPTT